MPIVGIAITPHSPILIPSIGKEYSKQITETIKGLEFIGKTFQQKNIETILFITPHGQNIMTKSFTTIIGSPETPEELNADFSSFGDFSIPFTTRCSGEIICKLLSGNAPFAIRSIAEKSLDYGISVPLSYIKNQISSANIVAICTSEQDEKTHIELGRHITNCFQEATTPIGVVISIDLAHNIDQNSNENNTFDKKIIDILEKSKTQQLISLDKSIIKRSKSCAYKPLLVLSGLLETLNCSYNFLSYESPFGVGYLCATYSFDDI